MRSKVFCASRPSGATDENSSACDPFRIAAIIIDAANSVLPLPRATTNKSALVAGVSVFTLAITRRILPAGWLAVPGQRAKMDAFGNQSVGEIKQILSYFDAASSKSGSDQNSNFKGREKLRKGTRKTAGLEYFAVQPGDRRTFTRASGKTGTKAAQPGIYRRTLFALGSRIEPIVIFVRAASYKRRFDFYNIAKAEGDRILQTELVRAIDESAARLRARS